MPAYDAFVAAREIIAHAIDPAGLSRIVFNAVILILLVLDLTVVSASTACRSNRPC